ncbi:MAG: hypothetical protein QOE90_94 [Thermoplasmata archaeon]|jgi:hypothetical protein|nr:hypothetical protein [Thermoplasmata archaeon]
MRLVLLAIVAAALLAPPAHAHALITAADPLILNIDTYPTPEGKLALAQPADGSVYFASYQPGATPTPLTFTMPAPVRFAPAGAQVRLGIRADKPVVTQDSSGRSFQIDILADGQPIPGASAVYALPSNLMRPGDASGIHQDLQITSKTPIPENGTITLRLTPLMPALLDSALAAVVGPDTDSGLDFPQAQIPTLQDLGLQDTNLTMVNLARENFTSPDPNVVLNEIDVYHENVTTNYLSVLGTKAYVELKGAETDAEGQVYHDYPDHARRLAGTHDFTIGGVLARVHPGVGVVVLADLSKGPISIDCVKNCGPSPLHMTLYPNRTLQAPGSPGTPLDATGAGNLTTTPGGAPSPTAVKDEKAKTVPGPSLAWGLALVGLSALARRRLR